MEEVTEVLPPLAGLRLRPWFSSERRFWHLLYFVLGAIRLLKGTSFPGPWAATRAQLDYRNGFVKRGLLRTQLKAPPRLNQSAHFSAFSSFARTSGVGHIGSLTPAE